MSVVTSPTNTSAGNAMPKRGTHHQRLTRLRDHERQRRHALVVAAAVSLVMLMAAMLAWLDFVFELSPSMRLLGWATIVAGAVGVAAASWRWLNFESVDAVCQAEKAWPEMGQRLRTSHDYQTTPEKVSPADPELLRALETETQERVTQQPATPLGSPWPILALIGLCGAIAAMWLIALIVWPQWRLSTARLWFVPVHYSDVELEPLPESLPQGEDLVIQLHVEGRPLSSAIVQFRDPGETNWNELSFEPTAKSLAGLVNDLRVVIPDRQSDLEVRVEAGPLHTDPQLIAVRVPLVLEQWQASVQPPSYTGLQAVEGAPRNSAFRQVHDCS